MRRSSILCGVVCTLALLALQPAAEAEVINDLAGSATAKALGAPQLGVVEVFLGGALCTGVLIDSTHVLTAQHCTFGRAPGTVSVSFHDAGNDGTPEFTIGVSAIAEIDATNILLDGTDLSILTLSSAAPVGYSVMPFLDFGAGMVVGQTILSYGFGLNGVGSTGHGGTRDGLRWGVENVLDWYGAALGSGGGAIGGTANILNTDFDDGTMGANTLGNIGSSATPLANEGTTAPGDSGGGIFVSYFGQLYIIGALSGGTTATSVYSDISWWTGTFTHKDWILRNAPGAQFIDPFSQVPEPATLVLCLVGTAFVSLRRRRKD